MAYSYSLVERIAGEYFMHRLQIYSFESDKKEGRKIHKSIIEDEFEELMNNKDFRRWVGTIPVKPVGDTEDPAARRTCVTIWKLYDGVLNAYLDRQENKE